MWTLSMLQAEPWTALVERLEDVARGAQRGGLYLVTSLGLILLGFAAGALVSRMARALLRRLRFNEGVRNMLGGRGLKHHEPAALAAWAVNWLIIVLAVFLGLEMLGINLRATVGERLREVLPRIVTSAFLFVAGALLAMILGAVSRRFLETAGIVSARPAGQVVTAVLTGFASLLALEQLGFAAQFVMILGIVVAGMTVLGLALAFGLGCRDLARDFAVEYFRSPGEEDSGRSR